MMGIMGIGSAFINASGQAAKLKENRITLFTARIDPNVASVTGTGDIVVTSIKNGQTLKQTYYGGLSGVELSIQADENTPIVIAGDVTSINLAASSAHDVDFTKMKVYSTSLTTMDVRWGQDMREIVIKYAPNLTSFRCDGSPRLAKVDLMGALALQSITASYCADLKELDIAEHPNLTSLDLSYCYQIPSIDLHGDSAVATLNCNSCSVLKSIEFGNLNALATLNISDCYELEGIDLRGATNLTSLTSQRCFDMKYALLDGIAVTSVDLNNAASLEKLSLKNAASTTTLKLTGCFVIKEIDLTGCSSLSTLTTTTPSDIEIIYTPANNQTLSNSIAAIITANAALAGTVYTNSDDTYYNTIETAAQGAGWTIEPLPA